MKKIFSFIGLVFVFILASCKPNTPAQKGYEKIKEDIKDGLIVPSSLKVNDVECYEGIITKYEIGGYAFQYKISYSAKNSLNMELNQVVYYGYDDESGNIKNYGTDSTKYSSAKNVGKKQSVSK